MKKFIVLAALSLVFSACGGTKKLEREEYGKTCEVECFYLATGLISTQDYENAETALSAAIEHNKDRERLDAPQSENEWVARRFQLALAEVVIAHRNKRDLKPKWRALGDAIQGIVDVDEYQTLRLASSDFVPKRDHKWFETALAKQSHPALQAYGGLVLIDWMGTLPDRWVSEPNGEVRLADLYIASQSVVAPNVFLKRFSDYVGARVGTIEDGSIDDLLESETIMSKFFAIVTPEYIETLRIVAETAEDRGYSQEVMPLPGQAIPALQGCEIVEKLIGFKTVKKGRDVEGLAQLAECLIRLGRGSFAANVLVQMNSLEPDNEEVRRLHVHNHVMNSWSVPLLSTKLIEGNDEELKMIELSERKSTFEAIRKTLPLVKDPVVQRMYRALEKRATGQFSSALQDARGLLGDYRATPVARLVVMTNGYSSRQDISHLLQGIKDKNEARYWRLMLQDAWNKGDKGKTIEYAEELMALDKQGDCDDVFTGLWWVMLVDKDLAWQRYEDWSRWLKTRDTSSCRRNVSRFVQKFHPKPLEAFKKIYPNKDISWSTGDNRCPSYEEADKLKKVEEADKSEEEYSYVVNRYVWCRVLQGKGTPKYHDVLKGHKSASLVDTYGWSLYMSGDVTAAVKAWKSIADDKLPVVSAVGIYAGLAAATTDAEFEKQWERMYGETHIREPDTFAYLVWADALLAAGKVERARRIYEHVVIFHNEFEPMPNIEKKCPSCRPAFKKFWGHENRFWNAQAFHPNIEKPPTEAQPEAEAQPEVKPTAN